MRTALNWTDYELIDCSEGEKLERWGDKILIRPDPQVIWKSEKKNPLCNNVQEHYIDELEVQYTVFRAIQDNHTV